MGVPEERLGSVAPIYPPRVEDLKAMGEAATPRRDTEFHRAFSDKKSLTARAFRSPRGLESVLAMNKPEVRRAALPAFGGIGTARALGKFYAMLANGGAVDGVRVFQNAAGLPEPGPDGHGLTGTDTDNSKGTSGAVDSRGFDRVLLRETAFTTGFMRDPVTEGRKTRQLFGPSLSAFGQPGAGGSHAFADPENNVAFAYVMNQMSPGVMPNEKSLGLVKALYRIT